jgi:hypothetical protein
MRWKLLILTSLLAAIAGVGLALAVILGFYGSLKNLSTHEVSASLTFALPLATTACAGFFTYRHTARRRKLQTVLVVVLALLLTLAGFALGSMLTPKLYV